MQNQNFESAWAILLSHASHILTIRDIKALKLASKFTNQLAKARLQNLSTDGINLEDLEYLANEVLLIPNLTELCQGRINVEIRR